MARPKNSFKPLYAALPQRAGRPAMAKASIGLVGPDLHHSDQHHIQTAFTLGREVARSRQLLITLANEGVSQAAAKGARDQAGTSIGYSPAKDLDQHQQRFNAPYREYDHLVLTNSTKAKTAERFYSGLDGLIIVLADSLSLTGLNHLPNHAPLNVVVTGAGQINWWQDILDQHDLSQKIVTFEAQPAKAIKQMVAQIRQMHKTIKA